MPAYKTSGLVLRRHNLGEADRIITFLTADRGKLRAVSRGVRRIKSRQAGHLELFSLAELNLAEGRNLDVVTSARLQRYHGNLIDDYERLRLAYLMAEMIDKLLDDGNPQVGLFELSRSCYAWLDERGSSFLLELYFKLGLLDRLGYRPQLDSCVVCHTADPERSYRFSPSNGGIVDDGCVGMTPSLPMAVNQIKLWRLALGTPLEQLEQIPGAEHLAGQTMEICDNFYDFTFGRRFRTEAVFGGAL